MPRGTHHWFDLCADRRIRAIRLFQDTSGWTPHYTDSGIDANFQPVCFGPSYLGRRDAARPQRVTRSGDAGIRSSCSTSKARRRRLRSSTETLFPYARAHAADYLARHEQAAACREAVALLRDEYDGRNAGRGTAIGWAAGRDCSRRPRRTSNG